MKTIAIKFKVFAAIGITAITVLVSGCQSNEIKCTTATDDNYNSTTNGCDENATCTKFVRSGAVININGNSSNGTYTLSIAQASTDYTINVTTDWGITTSPAQAFSFTVSQNTATLTGSPVSFDVGTIGPVTITQNSTTNKLNINITLNGYGGSIDGTYSDVEQ